MDTNEEFMKQEYDRFIKMRQQLLNNPPSYEVFKAEMKKRNDAMAEGNVSPLGRILKLINKASKKEPCVQQNIIGDTNE